MMFRGVSPDIAACQNSARTKRLFPLAGSARLIQQKPGSSNWGRFIFFISSNEKFLLFTSFLSSLELLKFMNHLPLYHYYYYRYYSVVIPSNGFI